MDPIAQKLQELDEKAETLQKQGKYGESLDVLEEILNLKRNAYGEESDQYFKTSEKLCELCNLIAMICLQKEKFEASLDFLKKAETLSLNSLTYKAVTFNNLACYYKRTNKFRTALQYLEKALKIEITLESPQTLADTHLNMCAVLSQLDRHQEALEHVLLSIVFLQDEFHTLSMQKVEDEKNGNNDQNNSQNQDQENNQENDNQSTTAKSLDDRVSVLAIAYHNMGVELEYLKRFEEAIQTYTKAVNFAEKHIGPEHALVNNLKNVRQTALQQIENQKKKSGKKGGKSIGVNNQRVKNVTGLYQDPSKTKSNNFNKTGYGATKSQNQFYNNQIGNSQQQLRQSQGSQQQLRQQQQQQQYQQQQEYAEDQQLQDQDNQQDDEYNGQQQQQQQQIQQNDEDLQNDQE